MIDYKLEDVQVKFGESLNNKLLHCELRGNRLVLTLDFDDPQFALIQYLGLVKTTTEAWKEMPMLREQIENETGDLVTEDKGDVI